MTSAKGRGAGGAERGRLGRGRYGRLASASGGTSSGQHARVLTPRRVPVARTSHHRTKAVLVQHHNNIECHPYKMLNMLIGIGIYYVTGGTLAHCSDNA